MKMTSFILFAGAALCLVAAKKKKTIPSRIAL